MSMNTRAPRPGRGAFLAGTSALAVIAAAALAASPATAATSPGPAKHRGPHSVPSTMHGSGSLGLGTLRSQSEKVDRSLAGAKGAVDVMLELDPAPASSAFTRARSQRHRRCQPRSAQPDGHDPDHPGLGRVALRPHGDQGPHPVPHSRPLLGPRGAHRRQPALRARGDPRRQGRHRITPKAPSNSSSVPLIGAPEVWKGRGETGQGVRVGIIDTGIDYTHADFGGPGTGAAYADGQGVQHLHPHRQGGRRLRLRR